MKSAKATRALAITQLGLLSLQIIMAIVFWAVAAGASVSGWSFNAGGGLATVIVLNLLVAIAIIIVGILQIINGSQSKSKLGLASGIVAVVAGVLSIGWFYLFFITIALLVLNILTLVIKPKTGETVTKGTDLPETGSIA